ncbi:M protein repeat protein [Hirsutella rhossiliensis]|uniref:M protein repeat protein n=1 Tax=Hirsutella rhossiliensis TaxID=111463 RepID=A0A9P8SCZ1_9HYPO|nr:M protein repeat protein [Hirsutella rhossiliensis]KAH0958066.1 M protein repeat protein [Hirsutella rhossiliensis]
MADDEEKARQEKIAAARKRVEQMKKKKGSKKIGTTKKDESKDDDGEPADGRADNQDEPSAGDKAADVAVDDDKSPPITPSLAQQSKIRSTSFRVGSVSGAVSPGPFTPDGETAPDIYRKHVARIEELERENKRLAKEAADSERRWKKAEEALSDGDGDAAQAKSGADDEAEKLKSEIASLQRQNAQLQQQVSRGSGHRASVSTVTPSSELHAELDSKTATIESMEIELSKLKARAERQETGASSEREQVTALEEKLARAEAAAGKAQRELQDVKRNLERATEKAVREGSERSSAETRVKTLEFEVGELKGAKDEAEKRAEGLDKKVATLTTLHKEQDARLQALRKDKEQADKDLDDVRAKADKLEGENVKLRSRKSLEGGGGLDDEGVDELENEERLRLERKIRSLEQELHEVHSGAWLGKRREMEAVGPGFQEVDLTSGASAGGGAHYPAAHKKASTGGGIGDFLTSGLNALAGGGGEADELLEDDDDMDFDEEAFRKAQEEEARKRLERIKDIKRSLKHWEGWRMDIVDTRRGGGEGIGDIFDV